MTHQPGEVSAFELREAATFAHIPWPDFARLSTAEQAAVVAHRRASKMIEEHYAADSSLSMG